jgi:hemerythrin-like metal-binding protein
MGKLIITDALLIGHKRIDEEHLHLASLINTGIEAISTDAKIICAGTIDEIVDKLEQHFQSEEQIMTEFGYADTEAHSAHHIECFNKLLSIDARCERDNCLGMDCLMDVVSMFVDDLLGADMGFKGHLQAIDYRG